MQQNVALYIVFMPISEDAKNVTCKIVLPQSIL